MNKIIFKTVFLIISIQVIVYSATVNGRLVVLTNNGTNYVVKAQVNTNTGTDDMGGATMILNFNNTNLSYSGVYTFHNFSGTPYSVATITNPLPNQLRINIELQTDDSGTIVARAPSWTDLVTINFNVLNTSGSAGLVWQTSNIDWAIFDGDNNTLWDSGTFTNEDTTPLPVELVYVKGNIEKGFTNLSWQTATEVNNYGFDVERCDQLNNNWQKIGFVHGHGNSNSLKNYSFIDSYPLSGKLKYRLKQIDLDGCFEYSEIVEVNVETPLAFSVEQNFPNPFNPKTKISYQIPEASFVTLKIYNSIGQLITNLVNENQQAGKYEVSFNGSLLNSGIYYYTIQSGSFLQTRKMLLLK